MHREDLHQFQLLQLPGTLHPRNHMVTIMNSARIVEEKLNQICCYVRTAGRRLDRCVRTASGLSVLNEKNVLIVGKV